MKSKNSRKIIVHILLLLGITITVFPFVWMILTSFKTVGEAMQIPPTIFPKKFLTDAYSSIVTALPFGRVYLNTIISTVVTTVVQVLFCSMAAYAFARIEFPFKNAIFVLVLSVLMVPGQIFLIPQYRIVQSLGLLDTIPALFLPNLFSAFGTFLLRQFFMSLPKELEEAALLDGCNRFQIFGIMLLAGMQSVSTDLYEAADIDGATTFQKIRYITIPAIRSVSTTVFLLLIIWTIKDYAIAYVLTKGGPSRATELLTIYIQQTGFKYFDFGKASAAGMLMLLVALAFTFFYFKVLNKEEE